MYEQYSILVGSIIIVNKTLQCFFLSFQMFTYDEWLVSIVDVVETSNLVHCTETESIRCKIGGWSSI